MGKIHILDDDLITKIAAGEVIERPASVVKELLENSLDANATKIEIKIEDAGLRNITIIDNGDGMDASDALSCFTRHATSKISSTDDIFSISTLGFRGEALASIAQISNTLLSSNNGEESVFVNMLGGALQDQGRLACPKGTRIEVKDLFYNVPARKAYLKTRSTETQAITQIVTKYALLHKLVHFTLHIDGKETINAPKSESLKNKISFLYGSEIGSKLVDVNYSDENIQVDGCICRPSITRSDRSDQSLYVNGRLIEHRGITDAVYEGMKTLLFVNRHPIFVLNIGIDPSKVDVNVHPTKKHVRFKQENELFEKVATAVKQAFATQDLIIQSTPDQETTQKASQNYSMSLDRQSTLRLAEVSYEVPTMPETIAQRVAQLNQEAQSGTVDQARILKSQYSAIQDNVVDEEKLGPFVILGQVARNYVICESPKGLAIIDQHGAHERVNYEKFMKERLDKAIKTQTLVKPKIIELTPVQYSAAMQAKEALYNLGFLYDSFGDQTIKLTAVPEIFGRLKSTVFIDAINELVKSKNSFTTEIEDRIIRFACRASVKAGDELTIPQLKLILVDLAACENPYTCPHGRPTIIELSLGDLEKKFKRSGW